jgi:hypothetical protein
VNEDNENIIEYSSDDDSIFGSAYTQLMTAGTKVVSDSERDNGSEEDRKKM